MEIDRFKELALDYERWIKSACRNKCVGDDLLPNILKAAATFNSNRNGLITQSSQFTNQIQHWGALAGARTLFYGLAIENACKARVIFDGNIDSDGETIMGIRGDHNIEQMANQLGVKSPDSSPEFLKLLTYQTQTLSKYPIAKSRKKQNEFTGRAIGARKVEGQLTEDIILQVLKHEHLIQLYNSFKLE